MTAKIVREQYRDSIDNQQPQQMLKTLVSKVLENSKPKSKYIDSFQSPKLPLSPKRSVYEDSYQNKPHINALKILYEPERRKLTTIVSDSSYKNQFVQKNPSQQMMASGKRKDNLKIGGPMLKDSSYKAQYPQINGIPMKETLFINPQNLHPINVKMKSSSSYAESYKGLSGQKRIPIKKTGNLKVNGSFIGASTYKQGFQNMEINKPQSFSPKNVYRPSLSYVVPTSYQSQFVYKQFGKQELQSKKE